MPVRWIAAQALATLAAVAPPLPAAGQPPSTVLSPCGAHRPAPHNWTVLQARCPGLNAALKRLQLHAVTSSQGNRTLDARSLAGLSALVQRYASSPPSALPDAAALRAASQALSPRPPAASLWDRLRVWLDSWTAPLAAALQRWLESLASGRRRASLLRVMLWTFGALLSAIALLSLYLGSRAGWLSGRSRRAASPRTDSVPHRARTHRVDEPDWFALAEQPSRVLKVLIADLVQAERLEHERNLTYRELSRQARFDTAAQREQFNDIALLAERERYGPSGITRIPDSLVQSARALHAQCGAASAPDGRIRS